MKTFSSEIMEELIASRTKFLHCCEGLNWEDAINKAFAELAEPKLCQDIYRCFDITEPIYKAQLLINIKKED